MSIEERTAIVRRQEESLNAGRPDAGLDLFADPYRYNGQDVSVQVIPRLRAILLSALPDVHWTLEQVIAEGDWIATRWTVRGTHTGDITFPGVGHAPATGKSIQYSYIVHHRIADGKIVESWDVSDRLSLLQQVGLIPPPGAAGGSA